MKIKIGLLLGPLIISVLLSGCAKFPTQAGTWVGMAESKTLYTAQGEPRLVVCLRLQEGPTMRDPGFKRGYLKKSQVGNEFIAPCPVLVDRQLVALEPTELVGKRLRVRGTIRGGPPKDATKGVGLLLATLAGDPNFISPAVLQTDRKDIVLVGLEH